MDEKAILKVFKDSGALLEGHFELRSKLHSPHFFQCAKVLCHPRQAETLCSELAGRIRARMGSGFHVDSVIAPAMGGLAVGHEIARALNVKSIFAEKQEGKLALRRFRISKGERVIVAEDVVTRGGRVQEVVDIVESCGGEVVAIAVLVDRSGGKAHFKPPVFSLIELEPVTHEPDACPLCEKGLVLEHPGS